jgi:hypothetical protein
MLRFLSLKIGVGTIFFFFLTINVQAAIIYVDAGASGTNNGSSWSNAYTDLQVALSVAFINDEVWVKGGIYKPTATTDRSISFVMKNGVNIYGGFDGTETAVNQRNISANPTTLSGDIGQPGDNTDNTKQVVKILNFTTLFVMDGFRVSAGYDTWAGADGAGAYLNNNAAGQITINNCIFYDNYAYGSGGGMFIDESNVTFNFCEFLYNGSFLDGGGGIYADNGSNSNLYLNDCKFIGNTSRNGTVITFDGFNLVMERNLITANAATSGHLIFVDNNTINFQINNSLIIGNQIEDNLGAIISSYSSAPNSSSLTNVTICHNINIASTGSYHEVIDNANSAINIENCIVYGNTMSDLNLQIESGNNVYNSIVENGYAGGVNVISVDPLFVNPSSLAASPFDASTFDYSLDSMSYGVNFGDNSFALQFSVDYLNNVRIQQGLVDCGAIESPYSDIHLPVAHCKDTVVYLDVNGFALIEYTYLDDNSTDNLGIVSYAISDSNFYCADIGVHTVTLIVFDAAGNSDSCISMVTVVDDIDPIILGNNLTVYLDTTGNVSINANDIDNGTSDNCGIDSIYISQMNFTCADAGSNQITFTATDFSGNTSSVSYTVNVVDSVFPTAITKNIDVYLNATGIASITPLDVDSGSFDDCNIVSMTVSPNSFSCLETGSNVVVFSVEDDYGNLSQTNAIVTVHDTILPLTNGQNIQVDLAISNPYTIAASDINNGSSDNCSFTQSINLNIFTSVGLYPVELTSVDASGNSSSDNFTVEVIDSGVGLSENSLNRIKVLPNPTSGIVYIDFDYQTNDALVEVFDCTGKRVQQILKSDSGLLKLVIEGDNGIYFVKISVDGFGPSYSKIVKSQ